MAGTFLRVDVNDAEVQAGMARLVAKLRNLRPFFKEVGEELLTSTKDRFDRSEAPDGSKWAANSETTLMRYAARGKSLGSALMKRGANKGRLKKGAALRYATKKPLIERGYLRNQLRYQASAAELLFGTNRIYGAVHQFGAAQGAFGKTKHGAPIPWGNIPARPYLGLSAQDRVTIADLIADYLREA